MLVFSFFRKRFKVFFGNFHDFPPCCFGVFFGNSLKTGIKSLGGLFTLS